MEWYKININDYTDKDYEKWYGLMTEEKKNRVEKFRDDDDRKRTVFADMLARKSLALWCSVEAQNIEFCVSVNGKPYAKGLSAQFSVSHSGDIVVCAVSDNAVGIDVEKIRPVDLKIAKRVCTEEEKLYLFEKTPQQEDFCYTTDKGLLTRFFSLWTAKEAYVKCTGQGLCAGLLYTPQVECVVDDGYVISVFEKE